MFDTILVLLIAAFAVACLATVCSIVIRAAERRRNSFIASLPTARVPESSWRPALQRREKRDAVADARTIALPTERRYTIADNFGQF